MATHTMCACTIAYIPRAIFIQMTYPLFPRLLTCLLPLALSACASPALPGAETQGEVQTPAEHARATADIVVEALPPSPLPRVPQPPERPLAPPAVTDPAIPRAERIEAFIDYTARTYAINPEQIRSVLGKAELRPSIIKVMDRPAEAVRQWRDYRPIFLNEARIEGGIAFYRQHRTALEAEAALSGVPAEYIVAIIGVETHYGRFTGTYKVLDALYTLAFDYPKRAPFFAAELAQLFALVEAEPKLDIMTLKGSYAGAMGLGQFMPSSYRLWARDGDVDGHRDLIGNLPDVFASIAHYFVVHGWEEGAPVVARAERAEVADNLTPDTVEPIYRLGELAAHGYTPAPGEPQADAASLLTLEGSEGTEHWLTYRNFYVITRYNRSPMYAMSVQQLAQAIRAGVDAA